MYNIGVFANISELKTFPFANIKTYIEETFKKEGIKDCNISLYTKEQKELFMAIIETGGFDGIVFSTNVSNDKDLKAFFEREDNKEKITKYILNGGGLLLLLQFHLCREHRGFEVFFEDQIAVKEKKQNGASLSNQEENKKTKIEALLDATGNTIKEDEHHKMVLEKDDLLLRYPVDCIGTEGQSSPFDKARDDNDWQDGRTPLFAVIDGYPEGTYRSIIDYKVDDKTKGSFCIVSRQMKKRVVITTLGLDLENNPLLANLISYVAKGEPTVVFNACGECARSRGDCDFEDLLNNIKIHHTTSEDPFVRRYVKTYIPNCCEQACEREIKVDAEALPIKQIFGRDNSGKVFRTTNTTSVKYLARLGAEYLKTQLIGGKYGSLIGTEYTLRVFKKMKMTLSDADKQQIYSYLSAHVRKESDTDELGSFDTITTSTYMAHHIIDLLNEIDPIDTNNPYKQLFDPESSGKDHYGLTEGMLITDIEDAPTNDKPLNYLAQKIVHKDFDFNENIIDGNGRKCKPQKIKEALLEFFAKILAAKDKEGVRWESDCYMTAVMLLVLLKIEEWFVEFDKKYRTQCVKKINIITSFEEESSESKLYEAIIEVATDARKDAFQVRKQSDLKTEELKTAKEELKAAKEELKTAKEELKFEKTQYEEANKEVEFLKQEREAVENRKRGAQVVAMGLIALTLSIFAILVLFVCFTFSNRPDLSVQNLIEFIIGLSPIEMIISIASIFIIPYTLGFMLIRRVKKTNKNQQNIQGKDDDKEQAQ